MISLYRLATLTESKALEDAANKECPEGETAKIFGLRYSDTEKEKRKVK